MESLAIGTIQNEESYRELALGIPNLYGGVRSLHFCLSDGLVELINADDVVVACTRNLGLTSVVCDYPSGFFDERRNEQLNRILARNVIWQRAMIDPSVFPLNMWPRLLNEVRECEQGRSVLFGSLMGLGEMIGPS